MPISLTDPPGRFHPETTTGCSRTILQWASTLAETATIQAGSTGNGSGSINLLSLIQREDQVGIAHVVVPSNAQINLMRFDIT